MKNLLFKYSFFVFSGILILASFTDFFRDGAVSFTDKAATEITVSKTLLQEVETLTLPLAKEIPFLKSWANTYEKNFDKILSYLNLADLLILIQMTLIKLSHWWILKVALIVSFIGMFIPPVKTIAKRILIVGLLISPGLAIYTNVLSQVSQELKIDLGSEIKSQLEATKDSINSKKIIHKAKLDTLISKQKKRHNGKLNLFDKVEDETIKITDDVADELKKIGEDLLTILRVASNHGLEIAVSLIGNIIVIFLILPLLYWYIMGLTLKRLFGYPTVYDKFQTTIEELKTLLPSQKNKTP